MSGQQGTGAPATGAPAPATNTPTPATGDGRATGATPAADAPRRPGETRLLELGPDSKGVGVREAARLLAARRRETAAPPPDGQGTGQDGAAAPPASDRRRREPAHRQPAPTAQPAAPPAERTPAANGMSADDPFAAVLEALKPGARATPQPGAAAQPGAQSAAAAQPEAVTLTLDGGRSETIKTADLAAHVMRSLDYTKKTQEAAEYVRGTQQLLAEIMPIVLPVLEAQQRNASATLGERPNWTELYKADPGKYLEARAQWDMHDQEQERLAKLQTLNGQQTEQQRQAMLAQGNRELAATLPGWGDPQKRTAMIGELRKWGREQGFSDMDLNGVVDPKMIKAMFKGMFFDRMVAGARTGSPAVPVVERGARPPPPDRADVEAAEQQFSQRPTVRSGAKLLMARRAQTSQRNGAAG